MRAWRFIEVNKPLVRVESPVPEPDRGEVRLDLRAAGMCHSDVGFWNGTITETLDHLPIVLGHENAGVISAVGAGVTGFSIGDRVTAYPIQAHPYPGVERDGGYADKTLIPAAGLIRIPDGVSFEQAAVASDAGMTAYHAVHASGKVTRGTRVGIIGLGGIGMAGAWLAVLAGGEVYAAEINDNVHAQALSLGVKEVFTDVNDLKALELDVIFDFAGMQETILGAVQSIKFGGRVVLVGLGAAQFTIPSMLFVSQRVHFVGSWGGTKQDIVDVLDLMSAGRFDIPATVVGFNEIGQSLQDMAAGRLLGKVVARIGD
ncbi:zinc-binding dehydrogenase [Streptomyces sp. NPDC046805]|uniref:zinc-binding dehydrogenase n=1 Tax=Streptomyces sp. NPDC046805 TaxID=3155134 RepID=UPI0033FAF689